MNIKNLIEEKTKKLEEIGGQIQETQKRMGELQSEALRLDGALNQLKELEEGDK